MNDPGVVSKVILQNLKGIPRCIPGMDYYGFFKLFSNFKLPYEDFSLYVSRRIVIVLVKPYLPVSPDLFML